MIENTNFPVFAANQVLKNDHLNDLVNYLEEQTRLTRNKAIGIGILCGFKMKWGSARDNLGTRWDTLDVSKGVGITSSGYLISGENASFSHARRYVKENELSQLEEFMASSEFYENRYFKYRELANIYEFFRDETGDDLLELYELVPVQNDKDDANALSTQFLQDKVLIIYLNCDLESLKNCDINDCDDKGAKLQFEVRYLLAPQAIAQTIYNREKEAVPDSSPSIHLANKPYANLKRVTLEKLNYYESPPTLHRHLYNQYAVRIKICLANLLEQLQSTFDTFDFILDDLYSGGRKNDMLKALDTILDRADSLSERDQYQIQYFYDLVAHLVDAYEEFRETASKVFGICCPPTGVFPKHLMLGTLANIANDLAKDNEYVSRNPFITTGDGYFPMSETSIGYRHPFIPSPQLEEHRPLWERLKSLHYRMFEMLLRFKPVLVIEKNINIIPSRSTLYPLSQRPVIPGYFEVSNQGSSFLNKLKKLWSYDTTKEGKLDDIYSHSAGNPNHISLKFRHPKTDFYRIEGHVGHDLKTAVTAVDNIRKLYALDFEIKLLKLSDERGETSSMGYPENLFSDEIKKHPGLEHLSGVKPGGTFYLVYQEEMTKREVTLTLADRMQLGNVYLKALSTVSNDLEMLNMGRALVADLSITTNKPTIYSKEFKLEVESALDSDEYKILRNTPLAEILINEADRFLVNPTSSSSQPIVVGDFALSYIASQEKEDRANANVRECIYPWMDNYEFLNKYSWDGNTKNYDMDIIEYTIGGSKIIHNQERISVGLASIAHQKLLAIVQALNVKYPTGLFFDTVPKDKSNFSIKHYQNQPFTLKIKRRGSSNVYTFNEKEWLKNGKKVYKSKTECKLLPRKYYSDEYLALHNTYAKTVEFVYELPPNNKDQTEWQKILKRRAIKKFEDFPESIQKKLSQINDVILQIDEEAKIGVGGSWKKGSWATKETQGNEKEFMELREKMTGKATLSDIDIVIESKKELKADMIMEKLDMQGVSLIGFENVAEGKYISVPQKL